MRFPSKVYPSSLFYVGPVSGGLWGVMHSRGFGAPKAIGKFSDKFDAMEWARKYNGRLMDLRHPDVDSDEPICEVTGCGEPCAAVRGYVLELCRKHAREAISDSFKHNMKGGAS